MTTTERKPTADEQRGMEWWNGLDETARRDWMKRSGNTGRVADAWEAYKQDRQSADTR